MDEGARLDRLTEREKECLRLWLHHKTAKEIALELGISHHAVEKRLKMARMKLDVGSSIEAARMLGEAEGYGQSAAQPPDLPSHSPKGHKWFTRPLTLGVIVMSILATGTLFLALAMSQAGTSASIRATTAPTDTEEVISTTFAILDRDESGYIEDAEAPARGMIIGQHFELENDQPRFELEHLFNGPEGRAHFVSITDSDGDGRVSFAEYRASALRAFDEQPG